jgi:DNA-directed RNA polymerase subunit RPC12/RpoP
MYCSICGTEIESIESTTDKGWTPYFYDDETEHEVCCPDCTETIIQVGEDRKMEVIPEYQGKIVYGDTENKDQHYVMGITVSFDVHNH